MFKALLASRLSEWNDSGPIERIFMKFDIWRFLRNLSGKLRFHSNLTIRNTVQTDIQLFLKLSKFCSKLEIFGTNFKENENTYFMLRNAFMKIVPFMTWCEKSGTARQVNCDNKLGRMPFTCWITKATDTHSECVIRTALHDKTVKQTHLVVGLYVHYISCFVSDICTKSREDQQISGQK